MIINLYSAGIRQLNNAQGAICSQPSQKHRGKPLLLTILVLGSFTCITQHTGPTALRPIRRMDEAIMVKCLAHRESNPHSGFLTTPELESGALDRSATTLHIVHMQCNAMQCNAMQCNAMQCNAMQCNAMQCNAMQCNAMQCNAAQRSATQRNATQRNATQRNATQRNATQRNKYTSSFKNCDIRWVLSSDVTNWRTPSLRGKGKELIGSCMDVARTQAAPLRACTHSAHTCTNEWHYFASERGRPCWSIYSPHTQDIDDLYFVIGQVSLQDASQTFKVTL